MNPSFLTEDANVWMQNSFFGWAVIEVLVGMRATPMPYLRRNFFVLREEKHETRSADSSPPHAPLPVHCFALYHQMFVLNMQNLNAQLPVHVSQFPQLN
mmetsp:Transcript_11721/g.17968  ORF Transcript_11721/g.17968 Transcript_11721/m.17968 type:complete len:99 (-) Transcript_11721:117-413(-)